MRYIAKDVERFFLIPLTTNRKVALSLADKETGLYQAVSEVDLDQGSIPTTWRDGISLCS